MKDAMDDNPGHGPLGQGSEYVDTYSPELLFPMSRAQCRERADVTPRSTWSGEDRWTGYEFSWLDAQGLPRAVALICTVPVTSTSVVESKSFKLYLNGFAQTRYASHEAVRETLTEDLSRAFGAPVGIELLALDDLGRWPRCLPGTSLDDRVLETQQYQRTAGLLGLKSGQGGVVHEQLKTDLFRSLCPVTAQPDWATIWIDYRGPAIDHQGLLAYLISYRQHQAFHETTIELIFQDILAHCGCSELTVYGLFQRRGGLDINPIRSTAETQAFRVRLPRQ